jgi:hypothetical protein
MAITLHLRTPMQHEFAKGGMKFLWIAVSEDITFRKGDIVPIIDQESGMGMMETENDTMPALHVA